MNKIKEKKSNKVYCYNLRQCSYYMQNGIKPLSQGRHPVTGRRWYCFSYQETKEVYDKWCKLCDKRRKEH